MTKNWSVFLFLLPAVLLLPILYYSLLTPFALVDDYGMCYYVESLDTIQSFLDWLENEFLKFDNGRYRPFFDFYNMVTWKLLGNSPWLHHLSRWLFHFFAIMAFSASFLFLSNEQRTLESGFNRKNYQKWLLPLAFLIYLWMFFPNSPVARLGPQEIYTVFFLGLCNWMIVRMLVRGRGEPIGFFVYLLLYLGYLGLSLSKEINVAVMAWILVFYVTLNLWKKQWGRLFIGIPLLLIFAYTVVQVYFAAQSSNYGVAPVTLELLKGNVFWISRELFQEATSHVIRYGFILLSIPVGVFLTVSIFQRNISHEFLYLILVLGEFVSMFLMVATSWAPVLRYYYVLVPLFMVLLAFSVKYLLCWLKQFAPLWGNVTKGVLACFLVFFISCNYYNFALQTLAQHSVRNAEAQVIEEVERLGEAGAYLQIPILENDPDLELVYHLIAYFQRFSPRFTGTDYKIYGSPPKNKTSQEYFLITRRVQPDNFKTHKVIAAKRNYTLLSWSKKVSAFLQRRKSPHYSWDAGVHPPRRYKWFVYKLRT